MTAKDIKIKDRYYHAIFGWCVVTHPPAGDKVLVDLEADEIEYYKMGHGYVKYMRDLQSRRHVLYTPISDLLENDESELPKELAIKKMGMNPKLKFWDSKDD